MPPAGKHPPYKTSNFIKPAELLSTSFGINPSNSLG
jgi:hypothetical protein